MLQDEPGWLLAKRNGSSSKPQTLPDWFLAWQEGVDHCCPQRSPPPPVPVFFLSASLLWAPVTSGDKFSRMVGLSPCPEADTAPVLSKGQGQEQARRAHKTWVRHLAEAPATSHAGLGAPGPSSCASHQGHWVLAEGTCWAHARVPASAAM